MKDCPACAGPAEIRKDCATCLGEMTVTQEVFDNFMQNLAKVEAINEFWINVQENMWKAGNFRFEANGEVFEISE